MENRLGKMFLEASLLYFGMSVTMGAIMTIVPIYRFIIMSSLFSRAHAHLSLIGWLSLAVIGFIYLVLGHINKPVYSEKLGDMGFSLLNIGIFVEFITLIAGGYSQAYAYMIGDPNAHIVPVPYTMFTIIFAFVMMVGSYMTIYNIYKTLKTE